ncbi:FAD-dependent oxidoreductase [Streptomyces sp. CA-210063]|uniref:FAD-dependent oxidoreductase n=1 Tax=Streptomyces sp. CA-210063 TaxID=2801029 RepID=UPI00214CB651|nr:FAD-dependent oxidoreductase [Streptomyces sp. CA-210063]UUU32754.1 FAD-dependent oxidoreductase [Streptomyces sp. CA-210063]
MSPLTPSRPDVLVIGGGIGGLSAALALARKGLRVRLYERSAEFGEVGAGLQLAPNCTRILDAYGLLDEAVALGVLPEHILMKDAVDAGELTRLDLADLERRYGFPYLVIHRSDLHGLLLRACRRLGVDLVTNAHCVSYENVDGGARAVFADGRTDEADVVIAADGLHSVARRLLVHDEPVNSAYVAYRAAIPVEQARGNGVHEHEKDVVVYVGPRCHFVRYPLRGGRMLNQVAVFESPKALAGEADWGTPDELDRAFDGMCDPIRRGLPLMWRDRRWRMFDRDPITGWVRGRIALLGDAAHPPLQYLAQGAVMAIEDGWVLAEHVDAQRADPYDTPSGVDWEKVLTAYQAVRPEHCRRVVTTARAWGDLWHHEGINRLRRNALLRSRDTYDYGFTDWLYGPTALTPDQEPDPYRTIPWDSVTG